MDSTGSLRAILANSPPKQEQGTISSAPIASTAAVPHSRSIPVLQYPIVNVPGSLLNAATRTTPSSSPLKYGGLSKFSHRQGEYDAEEYEIDSGRRLMPTISSQASLSATQTIKHRKRHLSCSLSHRLFLLFQHQKYERLSQIRKVSWTDPVASPAPSDLASEQSTLGSKADNGSSAKNSSSTPSLTSNLEIAIPPTLAQLQHLDEHHPVLKAGKNPMNATLAAAREISPFKGSVWEPEDDEWLEVDAGRVVETFKANYKLPALQSPTNTGTLSYFGTALKSMLASPTKKTHKEQLRYDERIRDHIDELENTYFYDPEGDLNDEVMEHVFLEHSRYFPLQAAVSPRNMHLIDLDAYFNAVTHNVRCARPRLCDAVATVLSHTSKACLEAFLDPSIREFAYRRELDGSKGGLILVIRREGNEIICGAYHNLGFNLLWKLYVRSRVSITGQWREVYAISKTGEMRINQGSPEWGTIRVDRPESKGNKVGTSTEGFPRKLELSPSKKRVNTIGSVDETNPKLVLYQSRVLARYLLWDIWYPFDKMYECRATWEADGVLSDVRLRRALVGSREYDED